MPEALMDLPWYLRLFIVMTTFSAIVIPYALGSVIRKLDRLIELLEIAGDTHN